MKNASFVFFGTPELSVWVLEELEREGMLPSLVVTAPDAPKGRRLELTPTPVKMWALDHDLPVIEASSLRDPFSIPELANSEWDLFIVAAYNIIIPKWLLALPKKGTLNVHPSLLPKLRGPSPVRSALLLDQKDAVGVTIMEIDEQIDHGPIVAQATVELDSWPIRGHMLDELLFREGGKLLTEVIPLWMKNEITPVEQDHAQATFSKKFTKEEGLLDLNDDGYKNFCKFCAFDGWPGTYFFVNRDNIPMRVKIVSTEYIDGAFTVIRVIPEGKREMGWDDFLRG